MEIRITKYDYLGKTRKNKMSNYSVQIPWSSKDGLLDTDPDKVVSGTDFHTEFQAVKTAINSKADVAGSAAQMFSATTAAPVTTSTTQVATTAFVHQAIDAISISDAVYPVGAIFTTVTAYADSAAVVTAIGGTTWVAFGAGRVLAGVDSSASNTDFNGVETEGGSNTQGLTIDQLPQHSHTYDYPTTMPWVENADNGGSNYYTKSPALGEISGSTGADEEHNNLQPYITVYMWKRTA